MGQSLSHQDITTITVHITTAIHIMVEDTIMTTDQGIFLNHTTTGLLRTGMMVAEGQWATSTVKGVKGTSTALHQAESLLLLHHSSQLHLEAQVSIEDKFSRFSDKIMIIA